MATSVRCCRLEHPGECRASPTALAEEYTSLATEYASLLHMPAKCPDEERMQSLVYYSDRITAGWKLTCCRARLGKVEGFGLSSHSAEVQEATAKRTKVRIE